MLIRLKIIAYVHFDSLRIIGKAFLMSYIHRLSVLTEGFNVTHVLHYVESIKHYNIQKLSE